MAPSPASDRPRRPADRPRPPSVERVLATARAGLDGRTDPAALLAVARAVVDEERGRLEAGGSPVSVEDLAAETVSRLAGFAAPRGSRVINATGVIIHTNLGRALWPEAAIRAAVDAAGSYVLLEMDRATGRRGARARDAEDHLVALTGGEDALVTNNNAAAVALAVGLFRRRGIAVSRGELVEIGGGVRIPEIVRRAGARLIEVGTTNRTRSVDFEGPLADGTAAAVLRVHPSNFTMTGFTELPDARELADFAHGHGAVVIDDLGSGALLDTADFGLRHEPTPRERLAAGSDLVTFSGDKLVGGPQAGLVVGRGDLIARMRRDPLARAMRPDKVSMAAVAATLAVYRSGRAAAEIPVWRMISTPMTELHVRAAGLAAALVDDDAVDIVQVRSTVGGGSLPGQTLPSVGLAVGGGSPDQLLATLRRGEPSVIARIEDGRVVLDLRTVDPADLELLASAVVAARPGGASGARA